MIVCDLTDQSRGNAIGVGLADIITQRLYDKIERQSTYANVITSSFLERGKIPVAVPTDRDAFDIAYRSCAPSPNGQARIVRILDTLQLEDVYVSPAILDELRDATAIEVIERDVEMFDASGSLRPF